MEFLKDKLGDRYDEFVSLLGDTKLVVDDGKLIPKQRFDEVNKKYKTASEELEKINQSKMTEDEKLQAMQKEANTVKAQYSRELSKLKAEKVFAANGLSETEYASFLDGIITDNEESTVALAQNIVGLLKSKSTETEKRVREEVLKSTPVPPTGTGSKVLSEKDKLIEQYNAAEKVGNFALMMQLAEQIKNLGVNK